MTDVSSEVRELASREYRYGFVTDLDQLALRVAVKAGGCSGMSYEIFFDTDTDPEDHEAVFGTVKVRVDPASAPHIAGATLDYKDGLKDAGFHIENPNAQRSCGCGQSFA